MHWKLTYTCVCTLTLSCEPKVTSLYRKAVKAAGQWRTKAKSCDLHLLNPCLSGLELHIFKKFLEKSPPELITRSPCEVDVFVALTLTLK